CFTAIVESHRGRTLQYAGDSLLAVFGGADAQEDDPERAGRAGPEIPDEAKRPVAGARARHGYPECRVAGGVHTGRVVVGGGVDAENRMRGIEHNMAARMEQRAPAGSLRVSHPRSRRVRGVFDVSEEPPIPIKGLPDPLRSYLVLRARPRTFGA